MMRFLITVIVLSSIKFVSAQWVEQGCDYNESTGFVNSVSVPETGVIWLGIEKNGWNVGQRKAAVSSDDGVTWSHSTIDSVQDYFGLKVKGIDANTAFASLIKFPLEDSSRIYRTVNGGQSWDLIPTAFSGEYEACIDFHFFNANEGVAFGAPILGPMTVYRTVDGGDTWTKVQAANLPAPLVQEGMFIYSGNGSYGAVGDDIWFGTTKGRIYKSSDRGQNWDAHTIDTTITIHSVDFRDANNGVAISNKAALVQTSIVNRAYTTTDGGVTWVQSPTISNNPRMGVVRYLPGSTDSYITNYGWTISGSGTQVSTDGGVTWNLHSYERIVGSDFLSETYGWGGGITTAPTEGIFRWDGIASNDELNADGVQVYPTITSDYLNIQNSTVSAVKCFDQMGREVEVQLNGKTVDVRNLSEGVYVLFIESNGSVSRHSFVVRENK